MSIYEIIYIVFNLLLLGVWIYGKYVAIRSLYNQKYQDKIDYLKSKWYLHIFWFYMHIMQYSFRLLLKGKIYARNKDK